MEIRNCEKGEKVLDQNKEMELLYRIDERVKSMDKKIDTVVAHNEKQNGWIQKHDIRITAVENISKGKAIGTKDIISFITLFIILISNIVLWVK